MALRLDACAGDRTRASGAPCSESAVGGCIVWSCCGVLSGVPNGGSARCGEGLGLRRDSTVASGFWLRGGEGVKGEGRVEYEGSRWGTGDNLLCRRGGGRVFKR